MVGASPHLGEAYFFFFFGNNLATRTTDMGENVPLRTGFFGFHLADMGFFEEKISKLYSVSHFPWKRLYSFLSSNTLFPEKWSLPLPKKIIFHGYFGEYCFFFNCMKNIQNLIPYKKVCINFCHKTTLFPQNGHVVPQKIFPNFFNIN